MKTEPQAARRPVVRMEEEEALRSLNSERQRGEKASDDLPAREGRQVGRENTPSSSVAFLASSLACPLGSCATPEASLTALLGMGLADLTLGPAHRNSADPSSALMIISEACERE